MKNLLALDTTLGACSVALMKDGTIVSEKKEIRARGHVERLLPMIDEIMKEAEFDISKLSCIAVSIGPGTFAGVRIGLSAAKGMALALNIPLIPITSLEALAYEFADNRKNFVGRIAVAIDARRGEVYFQMFDVEEQKILPAMNAEAIPFRLLSTRIDDKVKIIIGSGAEMTSSLVIDRKVDFSDNFQSPTAEMIAQLSLRYKERAVDSDGVKPLYLRAPDAKLPSKNIIPTIKNE